MFINGTYYEAVVKVRRDGVAVFLDGAPAGHFATDYSNVDDYTNRDAATKGLILISTNSPFVIRSAELTPVSGQ